VDVVGGSLFGLWFGIMVAYGGVRWALIGALGHGGALWMCSDSEWPQAKMNEKRYLLT
jgi:hypothetical protein